MREETIVFIDATPHLDYLHWNYFQIFERVDFWRSSVSIYWRFCKKNNQRYRENGQLYRKRQEINEHIFGTIKRQWGYNHTNLTGLEKVNGEHSLIMLVYNIKRAMNILGVPDLIAKLKNWKSPYKRNVLFLQITKHFKLKSVFVFEKILLVA